LLRIFEHGHHNKAHAFNVGAVYTTAEALGRTLCAADALVLFLQVPDTTQPPAGYDIHAEISLEVPVEHGLLIENLLDLAHAPFTHQG
jgi:phenylpropionate dioxygenase-like ring-hydroxylating dioxygenase large terminal subunit